MGLECGCYVVEMLKCEYDRKISKQVTASLLANLFAIDSYESLYAH